VFRSRTTTQTMRSILLLSLFALLALATEIGNLNPKCAACALLVSEVEGFVLENRTVAELEAKLTSLCPLLGPKYSFVCQLLVKQAPTLLANVESKWDITRLCGDLGLCSVTVDENQPDMQALQTYSLDLDLPPQQRWSQLCAMPHVAFYLNSFIGVLVEVLPASAATAAEDAGLAILELMDPEMSQEIRGCSAAAKTNLGLHALVNVAYELTDACTSIVCQSPTGQIFHARNLDFGSGGYLTATMRNVSAIVEFTRGGKVFARETCFLGFVGLLSGQNLDAGFTMTVNTRFYPGKASKR
jgi:hypothetical protein